VVPPDQHEAAPENPAAEHPVELRVRCHFCGSGLVGDARKNGEKGQFHRLFAGPIMMTARKLRVPFGCGYQIGVFFIRRLWCISYQNHAGQVPLFLMPIVPVLLQILPIS
jgi:hypothetical protein